jgi:hypothetical protein
MILLTLSPTDHLWLTGSEATRLAEQLEYELVCRTASEVAQPVMVADIPLNPTEAWRFVEEIQQLQFEPSETNGAQGDWLTEGF